MLCLKFDVYTRVGRGMSQAEAAIYVSESTVLEPLYIETPVLPRDSLERRAGFFIRLVSVSPALAAF